MKRIKLYLLLGIISAHLSNGFGQEADSAALEAIMNLEELMKLNITSVSSFNERLSEVPAIVTIIDHETIRQRGYRTIYDALLNVPGFWPIQDVNDKLMGVRGIHASTGQKYLLLINGVKVTENLWNFTDIDYNISLSNVKRIEINRGPGSPIYGRAALTAVINVVTFSGEEIDGLQLDVSLGNYGYKRTGFSFGTSTPDNAQIEVYGHMVSIDGQVFNIPAEFDGAVNRIDGTEIVDKFRTPRGSFGARYHNDNWDLNIIRQSRSYQQPRGAGSQLTWQDLKSNTDFSDSYLNNLQGEEHNFLVFDLERKFDFKKIQNSVTLAYTFSRLKLRENPKPFRDVVFPNDWTSDDIINYGLGEMFEFDIQSHRYGLEYLGSISEPEKYSLVWGLEAYNTVPTSDRFIANYISYVDSTSQQLVKEPVPGGYMRELTGGTFDKMRQEQLYSSFFGFKYSILSNLKVNIGGRYDLHVKGDDYQQSEEADRYPDANAEQKRSEIEKTAGQFSPRFAVVYLPFNDNILITKVIYNRSFIAPGYFYRYADPSTSYAGGPWLKAETLDNFMLSFESQRKRVAAKISGFLNINNDLLVRDNTLTPARYNSLGKLAMMGIECDYRYMYDNLSFYANYAFLEGNKGSSDASSYDQWVMENGSIKNFPKHSGNFGLSYSLLNEQLTLTLNNRWGGNIYSPIGAGLNAGTIEEIEPALVADMTARYIPRRLQQLDLSLSVYNVLNTEIRYGGTVRMPYHQAGRWISFSLLMKFAH